MKLRSLPLFFLGPVKDLLFPPLCFSCNGKLEESESRVCHACWEGIEIVHQNDRTVSILRERFLAGGTVDEFYSCYYFVEGGPFQNLVHALKYNAVTLFGVELGVRIGQRLKEEADAGTIDMIVPTPLHKLKQRERGYNQCDYLCRGIAKELDRPVGSSLVKRRKNTLSQTHLTAEERNQNVGDAFEVLPSMRGFVNEKTFLIVDDVITTGSTIQGVARVLKEAGAAKIIAASAALAKLDESKVMESQV